MVNALDMECAGKRRYRTACGSKRVTSSTYDSHTGEIHRPAKIELLTRLLPQAVLYLRLPPQAISRILTRFDLNPGCTQ